MKLLEAEPHVAPDGDAPAPEHGAPAAEAPLEAPFAEEQGMPGDGLLDPVAEDVPVEAGPACRVCGNAIVDGQDWCLECGTAVKAPRRLPGLRSLGLAGALALVLTGGAVAASYAALTDDPPKRETKVETVAQTTPAPTTTEATPTDVAPLPEPDTTAIPPAADVTPLTPTPSVTPVTPVTPVTTTPSGGDQTTTTTPQDTTPKSTTVVLSSGSGSLYDPATRATATGDPDRAIDRNTGTSWFATVPPGGDMNVGYLVDLGEPTALKKLQLLTKTPGFTVQVYGATGSKAPAAADDPKWTKLGEAGSVDGDPAPDAAPSVPPMTGDKAGDGKLVLPLDGAAGKEFRQVLVWFTTPPASGSTVRITEIKLIG